MTEHKNVGPTPSLSLLLLFTLALAAAWLLYGLLESSGKVQNEAIELGGAAAGFVVFLWVGYKILSSLTASWERRTGLADRNSELEERLAALTRLETPSIECPDGFVRFVSRDYGVGFSRPQHWEQHEEIFLGIFKRPLDSASRRLGFRGNIVITTSPYSLAEEIEHPLLEGTEEQKRLKAPLLGAAIGCEAPLEDVGWDETYLQNRPAMRATFSYAHRPSGISVFCEAISLLDPPREQILIFALHEAEERAGESLDVFRRLLSTARFWEPSDQA